MTSRTLQWHDAIYTLKDDLKFNLGNLTIKPDDLIVFIGGNGSGKTSLARALGCDLKLHSGSAPENYHPVLVSFEKQMKLLEDDYKMRNNDNASHEEAFGITPRKLFASLDQSLLFEVIKSMKLSALLDTPIRQLSGGEGRKVLLAQALCSKPNLIIFDTPFDALDVQTRLELLKLIDEIHTKYATPIVLIVNRPSEIPDTLTAMGIISDLKIAKLASRKEIELDEDAKVLLGNAKLMDVSLPKTPLKFALPTLKSDKIISLKNINVTYQRKVLDNLNFEVKKGEHWQIIGPNGAGKSTLLSFITGENPLVYANDVTVFDFKRGSGESIWDIKKYYGLVSGTLHLNYRVSSSALNVVLSGFYDSIGLYNQASDEEINCAKGFLKIAGLLDKAHESFKNLSFGQQRMLLIIRALVKNPPLLILDEPLQGLDGYARTLVKSFISYIMKNGNTSVLFVSHHDEDTPDGFTNRLSFIRIQGENFKVCQEKL